MLVAALCVGLALVFAGSSAASVLDRLQHAADLPHEHGLHLTLNSGDGGPADHDSQGHDHDERGDRSDNHPSPGHHHADAPAGALNSPGVATPRVEAAPVALAGVQAARPKGVRPGGLDRPPKTTANLV
jgi:hypothetical protein